MSDPAVLGSRRAESEEHGLEQGAALVATFEFLGCDVEAAPLLTEAVEQLLKKDKHPTALLGFNEPAMIGALARRRG